jgi:hypothetical protein
MYRALFALTLVGLVALSGCTLCCSPYDYCGPTFTGGDGQPCDPNARAGSILSGGMPARALPSDVRASQVLSETDEPVAQADPAYPVTSGSQPAQGQWTAAAVENATR